MNARLISPILIGLLAWSPVLSASGAIDFNRQIRPILSIRPEGGRF
jgi:hypothetical protein